MQRRRGKIVFREEAMAMREVIAFVLISIFFFFFFEKVGFVGFG